MKIFLQYFFSLFLALSIVAPSVISLINTDDSLELVLEQNEEDNQKESKEGKKEASDKDTFYHVWNESLSPGLLERKANISFYIEGYNNPAINIFLLPPEFS